MQGIKKAIKKGVTAIWAVLASGITLATATVAHAAAPSSGGSGMPWEGPINKILISIQGPVARFGIIVAVVVTGLMMAFGEHGSGFKKVMGIAFGGSMVIGVVAFVSALFGATF